MQALSQCFGYKPFDLIEARIHIGNKDLSE